MRLRFICPDCLPSEQIELGFVKDRLVCNRQHYFDLQGGIYNLLPHAIPEIVKKDALYHESVKEEWVDLAQLNTERNIYWHKQITDFIISRSNENCAILELGGGVGFDLLLLLKHRLQFSAYVFSEISAGMLSHAAEKIRQKNITYCAIDACHIPFASGQFDFIFMIAALHHFPELDMALNGMIRVLKDDGYLILGIEPNRKWMSFIALIRNKIRKILPHRDSSAADEEAEGFTLSQFNDMAKRYDLKILNIEPVWLLCGFLHYGLEIIYRLFRLKRRIRLPVFLERTVISADRLLFKIPLMNRFSWHYTVIFQK